MQTLSLSGSARTAYSTALHNKEKKKTEESGGSRVCAGGGCVKAASGGEENGEEDDGIHHVRALLEFSAFCRDEMEQEALNDKSNSLIDAERKEIGEVGRSKMLVVNWCIWGPPSCPAIEANL